MLEITNERGIFHFDKEAREWICASVKPGYRSMHTANCFVPLNYGSELTRKARADGATDADFGIRPEPEEKPKRERGARRPRKTAQIEMTEILFTFG